MARRAIPGEDGRMRINGRQIYILPTRFGLLFAAMLMAMLLGANNYGSNPGFLFTFLLAGLAMAALLQTWKNLLGLEIGSDGAEPVFAGSNAGFRFTLHNPGSTSKGGIRLRARGSKHDNVPRIDLAPCASGEATVARSTTRRGWQPVGSVVVESVFPLGLFRAWAYIESDAVCLVYPHPAEIGSGHDRRAVTPLEASADTLDGDDFAGHRAYLTGDNMHHVDWKVVARGRGWHTKQFASEGGEQVWLRLAQAQGMTTEQRLGGLTRAVLDLEHAGISYGLDLGASLTGPGRGLSHRNRCLRALALSGADRR